MTLEVENIVELIRGAKNIGPKTLRLVRFLGDHRDESPIFFAELTENGDLRTQDVNRLLNTVSQLVHRQLWNQDDSFLQTEAEEVFLSQFSKWGISSLVTQPGRRNGGSWLGGITKYGFGEELTSTTFNLESLKILNCLCDFNFGDRLLTHFTPDEEHIPSTWEDIKTAWGQTSDVSITPDQEEQAQYKLWQAGLLECDLKR